MRTSLQDQQQARRLHDRGVPLHLVESALLLASLRRLLRPADLPPLSPIRSLAYFQPVIDELLVNPCPTTIWSTCVSNCGTSPAARSWVAEGERQTFKKLRFQMIDNSEALDITKVSRAISSLPFHYSYGLSVLNTYLRTGASLVMTDEALTSLKFWDIFRETQCSSFAGVPYSYQILRRLDLEGLNLPSLNVMTQAGGRLQNDLISHFYKAMAARNGNFFVMYGQTEATARISVLPPRYLPEKLGSVGLAIPRGSLAIEIGGTLTT